MFFILLFFLRERFFWKKEGMRERRTVGLASGKEVAERMLAEAGIEGVAVVPGDRVIERYYYSPGKKRIVISSHAAYNSGYYEVMRAATTTANALQHRDGFGMIDLYLRLAPAMEWMSRLLPLLFVFGITLVEFNPPLVLGLMLGVWVLMFLAALLMRPVDRDASRRGTEWLLAHGIVDDGDRAELERIGRYLANYNLMLVALSVAALLFLRAKIWHPSDKSV